MTKLLIFIFALILPGYYAHSKINCNPPGSPTITPSSLTCNGGFFSSSFRPKSTALSSSEVFLDNVQSCNLNNNLNNLLDLQPLSVRSNQIIMLEDNWKKEYTKTNVDCSTGVAICTGLGYELCHGTIVPGSCVSGSCQENPSASCTYNSNCTKKVYSCYDKKDGAQNDGDSNDMAVFKSSVLHQIKIPSNAFPGRNIDTYALTGGEVYFRSVSAGSFTYKDYPLSFRMPCYGEVFYSSFSPNNIEQIQSDSDFSSSPQGQRLSCPKRFSKGSLVTLNNTDRSSGDSGNWPENFCGENASTNEINQTNSNFRSGFYSGLVFTCDLGNYNGPIGDTASSIQEIEWYAFPETESFLADPENLSILDNRFIRSNNVRTMFKFESDFFTHLLGSDTNGVSYGGLITEQNDLTNWFPSLLDDGSSTNWISLLTNCDAQGCNTSSSSLFDSLDPLAADHRLSDNSVINHMNTIAAVPVSQDQRDYFIEIPKEIRNGDVAPTTDEEVVFFDNSKKLNINRERFVNNLEIISEVFGDSYSDCNGENSTTCMKQEFQACSYSPLGSNCENVESTEVSGDNVGCCPTLPALSSGAGTCRAQSKCIVQPKYCPSLVGPEFEIEIHDIGQPYEYISPQLFPEVEIPIEFQPIQPYQWRDIPIICGDWVPYFYMDGLDSLTYPSTLNFEPKVTNPVTPNKLYAYVITQHKTSDNPYACNTSGPIETIPFNVSANAFQYNKDVGSNTYSFEAIVGTSPSNVANGKMIMSNVIDDSYNTNLIGGGSINDEIGNAACTNKDFGHCSWTAYCTQNPVQDNFFTTGGANNKNGLANCLEFSTPKIRGYVIP